MRPLDDLFAALAGSAFRRRFHLGDAEHAYLERKGLRTVLVEARRLRGGSSASAAVEAEPADARVAE